MIGLQSRNPHTAAVAGNDDGVEGGHGRLPLAQGLVADAGFGWIKQNVGWRDIEKFEGLEVEDWDWSH